MDETNFTPNLEPVLEPEKNNTKLIIVVAVIVAIVAITAGVVGYLFAKKSSAPVATPVAIQQPVTKPVVTTQPADETANWQTYTNAKYGFSFKYPSNWQMKDSPDDVTAPLSIQFKLVSPELQARINNGEAEILTTADVFISAVESAAYLNNGSSIKAKNLAEYVQQLKQDGTTKIQESSLNGVKTYEMELEGITKDFLIYAETNKGVISIDFGTKGSKSELTQTEKTILSTFKFTDSAADETAGWKTFSLNGGNFSFKYPASFFVIDNRDTEKISIGKIADEGSDSDYITPVFDGMYYVDNIDKNKAKEYLNKGYESSCQFKSWIMSKENSKVEIASFESGCHKYAAYDSETSTLIYLNITEGMLFDNYNVFLESMKLNGANVYNE